MCGYVRVLKYIFVLCSGCPMPTPLPPVSNVDVSVNLA